MRPALDQQFGRIAGAAADVDDAVRILARHLREQIACRPRALILEFQVLGGRPVGTLGGSDGVCHR
jgi:hypothetical protein